MDLVKIKSFCIAKKKNHEQNKRIIYGLGQNICCCSVTKLYMTLCNPMDCSMPGFPILTISWSCSNSCPLSWWCYPTISSSVTPSLPARLSQHQCICVQGCAVNHVRVFSNDLALRIRWPKYWIFSFSISPSNEYSGLISFRIDWIDLLQSKKLSRIFSSTTI